jgi:hypothetical protein
VVEVRAVDWSEADIDIETAVASSTGSRAREDSGADCEEAISAQLEDGPKPSGSVKKTVAAERRVSEKTVERHGVEMAKHGELVIVPRPASRPRRCGRF